VTNGAETRNDLVRVLGVTATQVRTKLGSRRFHRQVNQPLELATSSSPDALQFLALAYQSHLHGDLPAAMADYNRPSRRTRTWLWPTRRRGVYTYVGPEARTTETLTKAFALRERLTTPSRFQVETAYTVMRREWDKLFRLPNSGCMRFLTM